jgi:hypothetical protein
MKISEIFKENTNLQIIDSETIAKMLLCYYNNIHDSLIKISTFDVKPDLNYVNDYINLNYEHKLVTTDKFNTEIKIHKSINLNKHKIVMDLFVNHKNNSFIQFKNYKYPNEVNEVFEGPFIKGQYVLFYNKKKNILITFTFMPLRYNILDELYKDIVIRDLNSYVIDNVTNEQFETYILNKVSSDFDFKEIIKQSTISLKLYLTKEKNNITILKLVKETIDEKLDKHPFYKWNLITRHVSKN